MYFIALLISKNKIVELHNVEKHQHGPAGLILKRQHEISRTSKTFYVSCEMKFGTCTPSSLVHGEIYKFTQRETDLVKEERARDRHDRCLSRCHTSGGIYFSDRYNLFIRICRYVQINGMIRARR